MSGCRIARVKFKDGRAPLSIIDSRGSRNERDVQKYLVRDANRLAEPAFFQQGLAGYVIVAWDGAGAFTTGTYRSQSSPLHAHMLPQFVANCLQERLTEDLIRSNR